MIPENLLPCPFCGHVGLEFSEGSTFRWLAYSCGGCGIGSETRVQTMGAGTQDEWRKQAERDAIEAWNTRAQPPQPSEHGQRARFEERWSNARSVIGTSPASEAKGRAWWAWQAALQEQK
jgi:Lar family restriction alleviation protein